MELRSLISCSLHTDIRYHPTCPSGPNIITELSIGGEGDKRGRTGDGSMSRPGTKVAGFKDGIRGPKLQAVSRGWNRLENGFSLGTSRRNADLLTSCF